MLYQRLADELVGLMEARVLRPGDRLPSVRGYSRQKQVSVMGLTPDMHPNDVV